MIKTALKLPHEGVLPRRGPPRPHQHQQPQQEGREEHSGQHQPTLRAHHDQRPIQLQGDLKWNSRFDSGKTQVVRLESMDGCPIQPGSTMNRTFVLKPLAQV